MFGKVYEERQKEKENIEEYKKCARQMNPSAKVSETANVHLMADGAFVEVTVWVPKEFLFAEKESDEIF